MEKSKSKSKKSEDVEGSPASEQRHYVEDPLEDDGDDGVPPDRRGDSGAGGRGEGEGDRREGDGERALHGAFLSLRGTGNFTG